MRAIARRWLALHEEIQGHEQELEHMVRDRAPELMASHGISTMTVAEMLILVGDNPERIGSESPTRNSVSGTAHRPAPPPNRPFRVPSGWLGGGAGR
jgi:hypothetical protein